MNNILSTQMMTQEVTQQEALPPQMNQNNALSQDQLDKSNIKINKNKIGRHRRSKHEQEGRIYNCEYCGKSYLSKPALNNHLNTKHADILKQMNIEKRKRGRPRKYVNIFFFLFFF